MQRAVVESVVEIWVNADDDKFLWGFASKYLEDGFARIEIGAT